MIERLSTKHEHCWRQALQQHNISWKVFNAGVGGDRLEHMRHRVINKDLIQLLGTSVQLVLLMAGTNDLVSKRLEQMQLEITDLVNAIQTRTESSALRLVLFGIPPRGDLDSSQSYAETEQKRIAYNKFLLLLAGMSENVSYTCIETADCLAAGLGQLEVTALGSDPTAIMQCSSSASASFMAESRSGMGVAASKSVPNNSTTLMADTAYSSATSQWTHLAGLYNDDCVHLNPRGYTALIKAFARVISQHEIQCMQENQQYAAERQLEKEQHDSKADKARAKKKRKKALAKEAKRTKKGKSIFDTNV